MPVDTSSVVDFALSFAIFVGFVFVCRVALRISLASAYFLLRLPFELLDEFRTMANAESRLKRVVISFFTGIRFAGELALVDPLIRQREWTWNAARYGMRENRAIGPLGVIDRLSVIGLCLISGLPAISATRQWLGIAGITLLMTLYVAKGSFTFVLKDSFQVEEEKRAELIMASKYPDVRFPSEIATYPRMDFDYSSRD
jgi:hypothetical protein